ncbi:hypothetical protein ABPG77_010106 [Micractinium sp. CCAP 211/92]
MIRNLLDGSACCAECHLCFRCNAVSFIHTALLASSFCLSFSKHLHLSQLCRPCLAFWRTQTHQRALQTALEEVRRHREQMTSTACVSAAKMPGRRVAACQAPVTRGTLRPSARLHVPSTRLQMPVQHGWAFGRSPIRPFALERPAASLEDEGSPPEAPLIQVDSMPAALPGLAPG